MYRRWERLINHLYFAILNIYIYINIYEYSIKTFRLDFPPALVYVEKQIENLVNKLKVF